MIYILCLWLRPWKSILTTWARSVKEDFAYFTDKGQDQFPVSFGSVHLNMTHINDPKMHELLFEFKPRDPSKPHRIVSGNMQKTCMLCKLYDRRIDTKSGMKGRNVRSKYMCEACGVALCCSTSRHCYVEFHQLLAAHVYPDLKWEYV